MTSLKEFMESDDKNNTGDFLLSSLSSKALTNTISKGITELSVVSASSLSLASHNREKFSSKVAELVTNDTVLTELSNSLGVPKEHESEDEFVERAKSIFKNIISKKLAG